MLYPGSAEHSMHSTADGAFQMAAAQSAIVLGMADDGFEALPTFEPALLGDMGQGSHNGMGIPAMKAFTGPLLPGERGVEFITLVQPKLERRILVQVE